MKQAKKDKAEYDEKIKIADKQLMGTARPPVPIDAYMMLSGYSGIDE